MSIQDNTRQPIRVDLREVPQRTDVTRARVDALYQSACVVLGEKYTSPQNFTCYDRITSYKVDVNWEPVEDAVGEMWQFREATEGSAECVALGYLDAHKNLALAVRSEELSGADWLVMPRGADDPEECRAVEVSGIRNETPNNSASQRLNEKRSQLLRGMRRGVNYLDGLAAVVVFDPCEIHLEEVPHPHSEEC